MCFLHAIRQSVTSRRNPVAGKKVWLVTYCTSRPRGSLVIASYHEVAVSNASLHKPVARIQRVKAQGSD